MVTAFLKYVKQDIGLMKKLRVKFCPFFAKNVYKTSILWLGQGKWIAETTQKQT